MYYIKIAASIMKSYELNLINKVVPTRRPNHEEAGTLLDHTFSNLFKTAVMNY